MAVNFDNLRNSSDKLFREPYQNEHPTITFSRPFKKLLEGSKLKLEGEILLVSPSVVKGGYQVKLKSKDLSIEEVLSQDSTFTHSFLYKPDFIKRWGVFGLISANFNNFGLRFDNKIVSGSVSLNDSYVLCGNFIGKWKSLRLGLLSEFSVQNKNLVRYDMCFRHKGINTEVMVSHFTPPKADGLGDIEISFIRKIKSMHNSTLGLVLEMKDNANAQLAFTGNLKENSGKINVKSDINLNFNVNFVFQVAKNVLLGVNYGFGVFSDSPYNVGFSFNIK